MDGRYKEWVEEQSNKCYIKNVNYYIENIKEMDICRSGRIGARMGSESENAIIYSIELLGSRFALKIMPILHEQSEKDNKNEIKIASEMSDLAIEEKCPFFLYMLRSGKCSNFIYPKEKSDMQMKATEYQHYLHVKSMIGDKVTPKNYKKLASEYGIILGHIKEFPVNYMVLEMGLKDLSVWIRNEYRSDLMFIFLQHVLYALKALAESGVMHNNLKLQDVIIVARGRECERIACLADFGDTRKIEEENPEPIDYFSFIDELDDALKNIDDRVSMLITLMARMKHSDHNDSDNIDDFYDRIFEKYIFE